MEIQKSLGNMSEPGNILIVDDDPNHLYVYQKMLETPERRIYTANSGDDALRILLKEEEISLILMDVKMPGMNGFDTLQLIRQRKKLTGIPVIFISGVHQTGDYVSSGFGLGAWDYILSPPDEDYLKNKVNVFLTLHRQQKELSRQTVQLARQKKQLEIILTTVPSILVVLDKDGIATSVNPAFNSIQTRYPMISIQQFVDALGEEISTSLQYNKQISKQIVITREGKTPLIFDSVLSPLNENKDQPELLLTITDVTDSKLAEDLRKTSKELTQSNLELEQFAYSVSHDLKEPLRTVEGFGSLLSQYLEGKLDERAEEYMQMILKGTARMNDMIADILEYSRIGTCVNPPEPVHTDQSMQIIVSNLAMSIETAKAEITWSDLPVVQVDEFLFVKLMQNLISNAIKFHGKKNPIIHIEAVTISENQRKKYRLPPDLSVSSNMWLFTVRDNGIGIPCERQKYIFDIFKQAHKAEGYSGTGIGLAICKKIVEHYGGYIWVESKPQKGTTFYFTLPG